MRARIFQLDSFTTHRFAGNPAAVVLLDSFPEKSVMQAERDTLRSSGARLQTTRDHKHVAPLERKQKRKCLCRIAPTYAATV